MLSAMLVAITVAIAPQTENDKLGQIHRVQASSDNFLQSAQIKTLLVGTRFSHRPPMASNGRSARIVTISRQARLPLMTQAVSKRRS
jgi:hypothetical protein